MIHLTADTQILLCVQPADFRKGIDGLAAVCTHQLKVMPRSGTLFVFINRNKTMLRILAYDGNGFWLMTKRLSKGKFKGWPTTQSDLTPYSAIALRGLLTGYAL